MSYVQKHLLPGEQVMHRAHLHKITYAVPTLVCLAFQGLAAYSFVKEQPIWGVAALVVGLLPVLWAWVDYTSSEFAVTDKRVVIKVGFIQRRTMETMLGKVEAIGVDQGVVGRMLDYGTITVTGTGGTKEQFTNIAEPLEFRRQVQAQISAGDDARHVTAGTLSRDERECPYCAERILVKANVCKHCGRDVGP